MSSFLINKANEKSASRFQGVWLFGSRANPPPGLMAIINQTCRYSHAPTRQALKSFTDAACERTVSALRPWCHYSPNHQGKKKSLLLLLTSCVRRRASERHWFLTQSFSYIHIFVAADQYINIWNYGAALAVSQTHGMTVCVCVYVWKGRKKQREQIKVACDQSRKKRWIASY